MIWVSYSTTGWGNLYFLPPRTTMNAKNYLGMLKDQLPAVIQIRQTSIFMHDGAPSHRAKSVTDWLTNEDIDVLGPWPGNSPDPNPIQNLLSILKNKVSFKNVSSEFGARRLPQTCEKVWSKACNDELQLFFKMAANIRNTDLPTFYDSF